MAEALANLKREFGRHAVILTTRTFTRGGFLGLGGKPCVEITAAREMHDLPPALRRGSVRMRPGPDAETASRRARADGRSVSQRKPGPRAAEPASPAPSSNPVLTEMGSLKTMVADLVRETRRLQTPQVTGELYETYQELIAGAVAEEVASRLVSRVREMLPAGKLHDARAVRATLAEAIAPSIPAAGPIRIPNGVRPYTVALVGPTGVGKTTTVAKLAANFCLRDRRKVGLITLDTYRIAAVEQLKTYAQIIDVPLEVATSADQLKEAVARLSGCEIVLIDTAGRSQRDAAKIRQLSSSFSVMRPQEVHLVLSSAAGQNVLDQTIERFRPVGIDRVIFTKLDEALGFGVIVNSLQKAEAELSYVTTGQDVPSDIEIAEPRTLAELIAGSRSLVSTP